MKNDCRHIAGFVYSIKFVQTNIKYPGGKIKEFLDKEKWLIPEMARHKSKPYNCKYCPKCGEELK